MGDRRAVLLSALLLIAALGVTGCGQNPAAPSGTVVLRGTLLDEGASFTARSAGSASGGRVTVTVQEVPGLSVTVSGNGTFELEGLPEGSFTLVFSRDGVVLGTITITGAQSGVEVNIVVQLDGSSVVLVEVKMGDDEGEQEGEDDEGDDDAPKTCMIEGGRQDEHIELEGTVVSGDINSSFVMSVQGEHRASGNVTVNVASSATIKCDDDDHGDHGVGATCASGPFDGWKVHVKGTLTSCTLTSATVTATEVKVQKKD